MMRTRWIGLVMMSLAGLGVACSEGGDGSPTSVGFSSIDANLVGDRGEPSSSVEPGVVNVCAFFGESVGPTATFSASAPAGENVLAGNFDIRYPDCVEVWNASHASAVAVGASLLSNSAGWQLERIVTIVGDASQTVQSTHTGTTSAQATVSDLIGGNIWFKFVPRDVPPPGGQGCTPGYWKQSQHFGSWTAPYAPSTLFSAVFSNAFPGMTLLQVLGQGGGGLKALGRHTVAALLNAASSDVAYDLSVAQVIAGFNSAYASGDAGTIEARKNLLDMLNNQGCPLARNP